jgi:phage terminase large subunit-like protein
LTIAAHLLDDVVDAHPVRLRRASRGKAANSHAPVAILFQLHTHAAGRRADSKHSLLQTN